MMCDSCYRFCRIRKKIITPDIPNHFLQINKENTPPFSHFGYGGVFVSGYYRNRTDYYTLIYSFISPPLHLRLPFFVYREENAPHKARTGIKILMLRKI